MQCNYQFRPCVRLSVCSTKARIVAKRNTRLSVCQFVDRHWHELFIGSKMVTWNDLKRRCGQLWPFCGIFLAKTVCFGAYHTKPEPTLMLCGLLQRWITCPALTDLEDADDVLSSGPVYCLVTNSPELTFDQALMSSWFRCLDEVRAVYCRLCHELIYCCQETGDCWNCSTYSCSARTKCTLFFSEKCAHFNTLYSVNALYIFHGNFYSIVPFRLNKIFCTA